TPQRRNITSLMIELRAEGHLVRALPDFVQPVEAHLLGTSAPNPALPNRPAWPAQPADSSRRTSRSAKSIVLLAAGTVMATGHQRKEGARLQWRSRREQLDQGRLRDAPPIYFLGDILMRTTAIAILLLAASLGWIALVTTAAFAA